MTSTATTPRRSNVTPDATPTFTTARFRYASGTFTAEASDLNAADKPWVPTFNIALTSVATGVVRKFQYTTTDLDAEGEIKCWQYQDIESLLDLRDTSPLYITIFND